MSLPMIAALVFLGTLPVPPLGQIVVELVPDNAGPYTRGQYLTIDVWLHADFPPEFTGDAFLAVVQFDFSDTDPAVGLDPAFTFDFSSIPADRSTTRSIPSSRSRESRTGSTAAKSSTICA